LRLSNRLLTAAILATLILALAAGQALATPRAHDGGIFLRLSGGGGYARSKIEEGSMSVQFSGTSGDINLAIGGMIKPNLALHGTLIGWVTTGPDIKVCSGTCVTGSDEDLDFGLTGYGGGITYFFMPSNVYVSASICAAQLTLTYNNVSTDTDWGPAIDITAGKEWWVSDSWGLGAAGSFGYHSVSDPDIDQNWKGPSFAVRFSATYN
jgi:hypothetical protein